MPLNFEDQRILTEAEGYGDLGMYLAARELLDEITLDGQDEPEVLTLRVRIHLSLGEWEPMRAVAAKLATRQRENPQWTAQLAYATRRAHSIEAAAEILREAVKRQPREALLHYNLAGYECQLGEVEVAKSCLREAFILHPNLRLVALEDDDLKPIWDSFE